MTESIRQYAALIPAAGGGQRMGSQPTPKQYLDIFGKPLIFYSIKALWSFERIARIVVVLAPDDPYWQRYDWSSFGSRLVVLYQGGETRAQSVMAGLSYCQSWLAGDDWVMVHDAARPCLHHAQVTALMARLADNDVGGLLAAPLADTLKRVDADGRVECTLDRRQLWQAQTPQLFRYRLLQNALQHDAAVTDEASAIENMGLRPEIVPSDMTNLKVTYPLDLMLAKAILAAKQE